MAAHQCQMPSLAVLDAQEPADDAEPASGGVNEMIYS